MNKLLSNNMDLVFELNHLTSIIPKKGRDSVLRKDKEVSVSAVLYSKYTHTRVHLVISLNSSDNKCTYVLSKHTKSSFLLFV